MEEKTTSTFSSIVCFHQTGTHHIQEGSDCEDVSVVIEQADFRFWGLADGQSEKEYCKTGRQGRTLCGCCPFAEEGAAYPCTAWVS